MYAISDGGADSCILGKMAKVIDYTGRHANLVGYDPKNTKTMHVPIVTAIIKARSNVPGQIPILLKLHHAPFNANSPITLISEYQVKENDLVIDSVATKHQSGPNTYGTQLFQVSSDVHIKFEDKGGLMGFELLPIEDVDENIYETFTITSPLRWTPHKFVTKTDDPCYYDPTDAVTDVTDYPAVLNHLALNTDTLENNDYSNDYDCHNDRFDMTDMILPIMESHVLATATWHRVIYRSYDLNILRPFLAFRPRRVVEKTLEKTTQLAKMTIRNQLRRHFKPRNPHMNVTRIDEPVSTDPMFTNCRSMYHGYLAAQVFFGLKSHTIFVYGIKSKGEFPKIYRDFIRDQGAPSALRRDNAREEQSEMVKDINREFMIKDQYTEPYNPQQNPVESSAIRYIKSQVMLVLDQTGTPDSMW